MAGGKIDILIEPNTSQFTSKMEQGLRGAVRTAGRMGGLLGLAFGGADLAKNVINAGKDFQQTLNNMQAVSNATAAQMEQVSAKARELGADTTLTATSASDAAKAMAELAKGGFSVQQSMEAAKGTLQLAAAAQVDAAQAATIQSQAIQAFGLQAKDAAHVADVLAGAANASSAEMTDVAYALQASGTVAKQFGVSMDDTVTAIAMFANAGITGSDAGTLLKTTMLALTDQGKPAQKAIADLGLSVYDAQGRFVGLPKLIDQLSAAAKRMTPEQYQAATATLFGSDAMRFAGIAAEQGAQKFLSLRDAVTRQGQAAQVAAAQTQGLPGAMERLENATQEAYLAIFDTLKKPLTNGISVLAEGIGDATPKIQQGIAAVSDAVGGVAKVLAPVAGFAGDAAKGIAGLPGPLLELGAALAVVSRFDIGSKLGGVGGGFAATVATYRKGAADIREGMAQAGRAAEGAIGRFESLARYAALGEGKLAGFARSYVNGVALFSGAVDKHTAAAGRLNASLLQGKTAFDRIDIATRAAGHSVAASAGRMAGAFAGGVNVMKTAAGGLIGALGGPWGIAIAGATVAVSGMVQAHQRYKAASDKVNASLAQQASLQNQLTVALAQTAGHIDENANKLQAQYAQNSLQKFLQAGQQQQGIFGTLPESKVFQQAGEDAAAYVQRMYKVKDAYKALQDAAKATGVNLEDLGKLVVSGGEQWDQLQAKLAGSDAGRYAAEQLAAAKNEVAGMVDAARRADPAVAQMAIAIDGLRDAAASGEDRLAALHGWLVALGVAPADAATAMANFAEKVQEIADGAAQAVDPTAQLGAGLVDAAGKLDVLNNANAAGLHKQLRQLGDELKNVAVNGGDVDAAYQRMQPTLDKLAQTYQVSREQLDGFARAAEVAPREIKIGVGLKGADETQAQMAEVWGQLQRYPDAKEVRVHALTDDAAAQLKELGFKVDAIPGSTDLKVSADTSGAVAALDGVIDYVAALGQNRNEITVTALMDTSPLEGSGRRAQDILDALEVQNPSPQAQLIIDKLKRGADISQAELQVLASWSRWPKADLDDRLLQAGISSAQSQLAGLAGKTYTVTIDASVQAAINKINGLWASLGVPSGGGTSQPAPGVSLKVGAPKAHGGRLPLTGPGTDTTDGILGVAASGMPLARVDAGEWIINRRSSDRYSRELDLINRGLFPKLPGFAAGGGIGISGGQVAGLAVSFSFDQQAAALTAAFDRLQKQVAELITGNRQLEKSEKAIGDKREKIADNNVKLGKAQRELDNANRDLAAAEKALADARKNGKPDQVARAEERVNDARDRVTTKQENLVRAHDAVADAADAAAQAEQDLARQRKEQMIQMAQIAADLAQKAIAGLQGGIQKHYEGIAGKFEEAKDNLQKAKDLADKVTDQQAKLAEAQFQRDRYALEVQRQRRKADKEIAKIEAELNKAIAGVGTTQVKLVGDFDDAIDAYRKTGALKVSTRREYTEQGKERIAQLQEQLAEARENKAFDEIDQNHQLQLNNFAVEENEQALTRLTEQYNAAYEAYTNSIAEYNGMVAAEQARAAQKARSGWARLWDGFVSGGKALLSFATGDFGGAVDNGLAAVKGIVGGGWDAVTGLPTVLGEVFHGGAKDIAKHLATELLALPAGLLGGEDWVAGLYRWGYGEGTKQGEEGAARAGLAKIPVADPESLQGRRAAADKEYYDAVLSQLATLPDPDTLPNAMETITATQTTAITASQQATTDAVLAQNSLLERLVRAAESKQAGAGNRSSVSGYDYMKARL